MAKTAKEKMVEIYENMKSGGFVDKTSLRLRKESDSVTMESMKIKGIQHINPVTLETMSYLLKKLWGNGIDAGYLEWKERLDAKVVFNKTKALINADKKLPWTIKIKRRFRHRYDDNINYIKAANRLSKDMIKILKGRVEKPRYKYRETLRLTTRSDLASDLGRAFTRVFGNNIVDIGTSLMRYTRIMFGLVTSPLVAMLAFLLTIFNQDRLFGTFGSGSGTILAVVGVFAFISLFRI